MENQEFATFRKRLGKTQKQLAQLLGTSVKAVHSYEQGWRSIPQHVERQLLFLVTRKSGMQKELQPCWEVMNCPPEQVEDCPAWEFQVGTLCWFINGTICNGYVHSDWKEKMKVCRTCRMLISML
ncbi:MAG: helix-turn-helix domain-containing protein [Desulfohalobiaceae bacterium]|nr:helix-turn-helix domain-containing protein [Desulfohalobiaceae bacterium]